jgi:hypothetical protein
MGGTRQSDAILGKTVERVTTLHREATSRTLGGLISFIAMLSKHFNWLSPTKITLSYPKNSAECEVREIDRMNFDQGETELWVQK